ncbi:MAG: FeoB-associated Cys-rich membrane protein [Clostridiales bacterium]|nr:FeoB-associated Cys-rich membrane protein [Clostridiales bacterium]MCD8215496.1 FeoB-associated Cys-rich membrane protein [Clostridiales bacterium]
MNFPSFVVLAILIAMVVLIIRSLIKGKHGCGGDCAHCGAACHSFPSDDKKEEKK